MKMTNEYNFWDDRTHDLEFNPCEGCSDYVNDECVSNGACGVPISGKQVSKKILPKYFKEALKGNKNFELRYDDDNIQVGDTLILREWNGREYTGLFLVVIVTYVLRNVPEYGLQEGYCIIGWKN